MEQNPVTASAVFPEQWKRTMLLTGAEIIAEVLIEQKATTIFGYPGGAVLNIYDALYEYRDKIRHIMTAHEEGASHAADGYARSTGKTGVVLATSGPGATNLVTGIATAYMDSVPLVALTGNVGTGLIGRDSFQEVYITGITLPITKHNFVVRDVTQLADILRSAFRIAQTGRCGPVLVDIPKDVTAAKTEFQPLGPIEIPQPRLPPKTISVVQLISSTTLFGRSSTLAAELSAAVLQTSLQTSFTPQTFPHATPSWEPAA